MAVSTGKRKRVEDENEPGNDHEDEGALRVRFQRAFEAKFKSLERSTSFSRSEEPEESNESPDVSDESDWSGLSDGENAVEIVDHDSHSETQGLEIRERKAFMVRKIECVGLSTVLTDVTVFKTTIFCR